MGLVFNNQHGSTAMMSLPLTFAITLLLTVAGLAAIMLRSSTRR